MASYEVSDGDMALGKIRTIPVLGEHEFQGEKHRNTGGQVCFILGRQDQTKQA